MTAPPPPSSPLRTPRTRDLLRLLVGGVKEYAIFLLDPRGRVATWNSGAERIKGWREDEVVGQHLSVFYPEEDARAGKPDLELAAAERDGSFEDQGWRIRKDGTRFWANAVIMAIREPDGSLAGFAKVTRDLTERRRAEEARRQLEAAREAVRTRDDFLTIVSHEFRTPLTTLQLDLQSVLRRLVEGEPLARVHLDKIAGLQRHITRLDELVNGLLNVSRIAAGQLELRRAPFDLADLVREVVARWEPVAARRGAALSADVHGPLLGAWDRQKLSDAFSAVLDNALKYGAGAPVRLLACERSGTAVVEVEDRGPGIAPEDQARVFERFERAVPVVHYGGFGVGLWMARQVAIAHGGDIEIRSHAGEGSCFTFKLPLQH